MRNEVGTQELRVGIDEEMELTQDGEPHIVGTNDQCVVVVVGLDYRIDETVSVGD